MAKLNSVLYKKIIDRLEGIISTSNTPEIPEEAQNTVNWIKKLYPDADYEVLIAAYAHDIDRVSEEKVNPKIFGDYATYKQAQDEHSADIVKRVLEQLRIPSDIITRIYKLIRNHDNQDDPSSNLLKDAIILSFFEQNLLPYAKDHKSNEIKSCCEFGLHLLSNLGNKKLHELLAANSNVAHLLEEIKVKV